MSSKKKRRHKEYLERKKKRDAEKEKRESFLKANSLEEMARVMGIKLK